MGRGGRCPGATTRAATVARPAPKAYDAAMNASLPSRRLRVGMAGLGMIFDDTYRPVFEQLHADGLYRRDFGPVEVELIAVASRTGHRAERYRQAAGDRVGPFVSCSGPDALPQLLAQGV